MSVVDYLARLTHISRKTLSKPHLRHPDGSLRLAALARFYATLYHLLGYSFSPEEHEVEWRWLMESQLRISTGLGVHPEMLRIE